jgi:high-affinity iron transporter
MVDAILLILREVLEAALIITMLMVMSRKLSITLNWVLPALIFGGVSSWLLAHYAYVIADAFDGAGQELVNAALYFLVILSFIVVVLVIAPLLFSSSSQFKSLSFVDDPMRFRRKLLLCCIVFAVGLSLAREVAEIWIYFGGFLHQPGVLQSALTGGTIGIGIGISLGIIIYYLLVFISVRVFLYILFIFCSFCAVGFQCKLPSSFCKLVYWIQQAPYGIHQAL